MSKRVIPKREYDEQAPYNLSSTQEWFASVITRELDENGDSQSLSPKGMYLEEEAAKYVVPSPTLKPDKRVQIYNQQYWWRLLKTLHDNFPLVTRLFGYQSFNQEIAIPYLLRYPPYHWSLSIVGERLPHWIKEEYKALDLPLIRNAADLDWAFHACFLNPQKPPLNVELLTKEQDSSKLLTCTFYLQPYVFLFKWDYDLLAFREAFVAHDVDYWIDHDFPPLLKEQTYYFVLYRSPKNYIAWKKISAGEYALLQEFKKGSTLEAACAVLEKDDALYEEAASHLQEWMQEWTIRQWLTLDGAHS